MARNGSGQLRIESGKSSDTGSVRGSNEDGLLSLELAIGEVSKIEYCGLFAVADGVGGHERGEVASSLAIRGLASNLLGSLILPGLKEEADQVGPETISKMLVDSVKAVNKEIYSSSRKDNNDMGTTLAAVLIVDSTAYILNIGDSRVYLLDDARLKQITRDHSLVAGLVAAGQISQEEIYTHPKRNIITRCLGIQEDIEVDLFTEELKPGQSLVLCSDGLWEMVRDEQIKKILLKSDNPQISCEQLIEAANQNGGVDNISTIVIKVAG